MTYQLKLRSGITAFALVAGLIAAPTFAFEPSQTECIAPATLAAAGTLHAVKLAKPCKIWPSFLARCRSQTWPEVAGAWLLLK